MAMAATASAAQQASRAAELLSRSRPDRQSPAHGSRLQNLPLSQRLRRVLRYFSRPFQTARFSQRVFHFGFECSNVLVLQSGMRAFQNSHSLKPLNL
jgi:hypothetical protein